MFPKRLVNEKMLSGETNAMRGPGGRLCHLLFCVFRLALIVLLLPGFVVPTSLASVTGQPTHSGSTNWTYDTKDRLLSEVSARLGGYSQSFGYDNSGNPTTFKGVAQLFNTDNQRNASGYVFDGDGNPTTYAGVSLTFDVEDRLTQVGGTLAAAYRADGLRAYKENLVSEARTYFLYDGGLPVVEMSDKGAVLATNVYGPDGLVASQRSGAWTYYTFDQQGNVSQRLNSSESVLSSSIYDAYGVESSTGSPTDPFAYNAQWGYYLDRETGLYACMFRYYDPAQGRWLNRDPMGPSGGLNLYGYCDSGPVGWTDPSGGLPVLLVVAAFIIVNALSVENAHTPSATPSSGANAVSELSQWKLGVICDTVSLTAGARLGSLIGTARTGEKLYEHGKGEARKTYRERHWRERAKEPGAQERWGSENLDRMKRGSAPLVRYPKNGKRYPMDLEHAGTDYAKGDTKYKESPPWEHVRRQDMVICF